MGNWLKGRVLIIPDQATATTTNVTASTSNTTSSSNTANAGSNRYGEQIVAALASSNAPPHNYHRQLSDDYSFGQPIYYPPYSSSLFNQFTTEEKQIQLAKRIGLIQHLPTGTYDGGGSGSDSGGGGGGGGDSGSTKNLRECVICMVEFSKGDSIRFLPCLHTYHVHCIDDWLMRSFICPSCMEPVDVALLNTL